jgi:hypothetical protein
VQELLGAENPDVLPIDKRNELTAIMGTHFRSQGFELSPVLSAIQFA